MATGGRIAFYDEWFTVDLIDLAYCLIDILPALRRQHLFPAVVVKREGAGIHWRLSGKDLKIWPARYCSTGKSSRLS